MKQAGYDELFKKALKAGQDRNYAEAIDLLSRITSETDAIPQAYLYLGRSYHALGRYDLAIQPLRYFTEIRPDSVAGFFFLGRAYLALGAPEYAVRNLKRVLEREPDSPSALSLIGLAYLRARHPEIASEYLARAVALDPDNRKLYTGYLNALLVHAIRLFHRGDLDVAGQMLEFIRKQGNDGVLLHLYLAIIRRESGDLPEALEHYEAAIRMSPDDPVIRFQHAALLHRMGDTRRATEELGRLNLFPQPEQFSWEAAATDRVLAIQHFQRGEHAKAIAHAVKVLHGVPKDVDMHLLVGEAYRALGDLTKAGNHFQRVLDVDKRLLEPRYGLAMIHWQGEDWSALRRELGAIERIDPGNAIASYYSCLCACKLGEPTDTTIPALQEEIRKSGPDAFLFSALGSEYVRSGRASLAQKWFEKSIKLAENHRPAYSGLISVHRSLDNRDEATAAYKAYLDHFGDDTEVRKEFIHFLVDSGGYRDAVAQIQRLVPYQKNDSKLVRLLALCQRKIGEYREAAIIYRRLLRDDPSNEDLLRSLIYCMEKLGRRDNALALLEKAVQYLRSPSPTLLLILGVFYYRAHDAERAMAAFRRVTEIARDEWRAYLNMAMIYKAQHLTPMADKYFAKAEQLKAQQQRGAKARPRAPA